MDEHDRLPQTGLYTLFYAWITLLAVGTALWHYQMGAFDRILLPAALGVALLVATLMSLAPYASWRAAALITLLASYLLIADILLHSDRHALLWLGAPPVLSTLLLPPGRALVLNLALAPAWLWLLKGGWPPLGPVLAYLAITLTGALARWEIARQLTLDRLTSPHDPECDALSRDTIAECLHQEYQRAHLLDRRLSVLVIHLPQLEMANEQFGAGLRRELLQRFCQAARHCCRLDDTLGRAGDSLLWMLLPGTNEHDALMTRNRLLTYLDGTSVDETGHLSAQVIACTLHHGESLAAFRQRMRIKEQALMDSTP
ncbi:diguanylate cyclase [Halomonas sp. YLGW01]|uniref:GGDEF domain-containing protein n=1 Tax=Halomonas sp. YLGW01 TaxID=2773308 RepID=UPI0017877BAE|nr:diguanylate cyclase [Halomonas sp. YLGW01]